MLHRLQISAVKCENAVKCYNFHEFSSDTTVAPIQTVAETPKALINSTQSINPLQVFSTCRD